MKKRQIITLVLAVTAGVLHAQQDMQLKHLIHVMPDAWYATAEAQAAVDSILKYQFPSGGWTKNHSWQLAPDEREQADRDSILRAIKSKEGIGATIDNGATITEMAFLAKSYAATKKKTVRKAFVCGVEYLLNAQYDNGGWPQFYPHKPNWPPGTPYYSDHITFNDNAIYNVMYLLRELYEDHAPYDQLKLGDDLKARCRKAFDKGIECILNCQIRKNGKLTVWCQQHDEFTLQPAKARAYELPSFTGSHETPHLLKLLMSLPEPSERVIEAVSAAVAWLESHAIKDMRYENFVNKDGKRDRRLVHQFGAPLIWARYYDLDTEEPYVCDRDGVKQPALEYIGYERRNGYGWYNDDPQNVIDHYPKWLKKVQKK